MFSLKQDLLSSEWVNLNPQNDPNSLNLYYNERLSSFSLSPIFEKAALPELYELYSKIFGLKLKLPFLQLHPDFIKECSQLKSLDQELKKPSELEDYSNNEVFLDRMSMVLDDNYNQELENEKGQKSKNFIEFKRKLLDFTVGNQETLVEKGSQPTNKNSPVLKPSNFKENTIKLRRKPLKKPSKSKEPYVIIPLKDLLENYKDNLCDKSPLIEDFLRYRIEEKDLLAGFDDLNKNEVAVFYEIFQKIHKIRPLFTYTVQPENKTLGRLTLDGKSMFQVFETCKKDAKKTLCSIALEVFCPFMAYNHQKQPIKRKSNQIKGLIDPLIIKYKRKKARVHEESPEKILESKEIPLNFMKPFENINKILGNPAPEETFELLYDNNNMNFDLFEDNIRNEFYMFDDPLKLKEKSPVEVQSTSEEAIPLINYIENDNFNNYIPNLYNNRSNSNNNIGNNSNSNSISNNIISNNIITKNTPIFQPPSNKNFNKNPQNNQYNLPQNKRNLPFNNTKDKGNDNKIRINQWKNHEKSHNNPNNHNHHNNNSNNHITTREEDDLEDEIKRLCAKKVIYIDDLLKEMGSGQKNYPINLAVEFLEKLLKLHSLKNEEGFKVFTIKDKGINRASVKRNEKGEVCFARNQNHSLAKYFCLCDFFKLKYGVKSTVNEILAQLMKRNSLKSSLIGLKPMTTSSNVVKGYEKEEKQQNVEICGLLDDIDSFQYSLNTINNKKKNEDYNDNHNIFDEIDDFSPRNIDEIVQKRKDSDNLGRKSKKKYENEDNNNHTTSLRMKEKNRSKYQKNKEELVKEKLINEENEIIFIG